MAQLNKVTILIYRGHTMSQDTPNKPTRGGARKGAGRKAGSGQFKEPTVVKTHPRIIGHFIGAMADPFIKTAKIQTLCNRRVRCHPMQW